MLLVSMSLGNIHGIEWVKAMCHWPEKIVESVDKLRDEIWPIRDTNGAYIFRGQPCAKDKLRSSIDRILIKITSEKYRLICEERTISDFRRLAAEVLSPVEFQILQQDKIAALTVMRHYGVPTRLLDWTKSPWVAAYFACSENHSKRTGGKQNYGAIWILDSGELFEKVNSLETRILGSNPTEDDLKSPECPIPPTVERVAFDANAKRFVVRIDNQIQNARMVAQQGLFTFASRHNTDHDQQIAECISPGCDTINERIGRRILIPQDVKLEVLRMLSSMNITPASLFPGADGVGRAIANELLWK